MQTVWGNETFPTRSWRSSPDAILGLDPGLGTTGWGLIEAEGNRLSPYRQRAAQDRHGRAAAASGLRASPTSSRRCIAEHRPDAAAVEEVFVNKNPQSTLKLGQARGVVLMCAARAGHRGRRICRAAGQEGGGRHRRRREGAGPCDGRAAAARREDRRPRRRRRARGRDHPRASSGDARAAALVSERVKPL